MNHEQWNKARSFHGHECPGLAIGVRACEAAIIKMGITPSPDEELVCVTENDACGVDAIQALLGCTLGKGNLIYKNIGKQAFTFYRRSDGQALRFYLKSRNEGMDRAQYQQYLLSAPIDELFDYHEVDGPPPQRASIFTSVKCESCGELAAETHIRLQQGKQICMDCFIKYERGW